MRAAGAPATLLLVRRSWGALSDVNLGKGVAGGRGEIRRAVSDTSCGARVGHTNRDGRVMKNGTDRRIDHARRRRVDQLIARVRRARAEIVDRGLDAVHGPEGRDRTVAKDDAPTDPPARRP
jgi:hypothetical protein